MRILKSTRKKFFIKYRSPSIKIKTDILLENTETRRQWDVILNPLKMNVNKEFHI